MGNAPFDAEVLVTSVPKPTFEAAFRRFHAENPHVYERLKRLAFKLKVRGVQRYGIKALWEVLRYEESVATNAAASSYRLNNNFTSMYARLLMAQEEDLEGFFELRERVTQRGRVDG